jgi:P-type Ca2+ transporter type 2C
VIASEHSNELGGLSSAEARARLKAFGRNLPVRRRPGARLVGLARSLADPMALMLAVAGAVFFALGHHTEGLVLFAALIPVLGVDVALEMRSRNALGKLAAAIAPRAQVVRDGKPSEIPSEEIVAGDLLILSEGDIVHADGVVLSAFNLAVDESQLTGESEPQSKKSANRQAGAGEAGEDSRVFAGSRVLSGQGRIRVTATGESTRYGLIARLVGESGFQPTPLQRKTARMVRRIAELAIGASLVVFFARLLHGTELSHAFLYAITLAMAAVGEEFVLVLTLFLAAGAFRLGRVGVLVRRIASVETLGSTTVICLDKTGTLTAGAYTLAEHAPLAGEISDPALLEAAALACEPNPTDSLERSILEHCADHGVDVRRLHGEWQLVHDYDFELAGKHMSHVWRRADGQGARIVAKGALEGILEHCVLGDGAREGVNRANAELAARGMRVLAVAGRRVDATGAGFSGVRAEDESGLELYGLLGFSDPVRPQVPAAIAECQRAGVKLKLITGDHALTAHAVADATGLFHYDDGIATGADLDRASPERLASLVRDKSIFARVRPEQKYAIVDALVRAGEVVAMTGDGVNDAPALSRANIGVSMGRRATEVARATADIVLLEDNLAGLVATVREGRCLLDNIEQAFRYVAGFKVMVAMIALAAPVMGIPVLLTPLDVVWLELIVHPVSALAFEGIEPGEDVMGRPPRDPARPILAGGTVWRSAASGAMLALGALAIYLLLLGRGEVYARSVAMTAVISGSLLLVWCELAADRPWWRARPPRSIRFWAVCILVALSLPLFMNIGPLAEALGLTSIAPLEFAWATAIALAATGWRAFGQRRRGSTGA